MALSRAARGRIPMSSDAALVTTLAGTAMPFAHDADDEAERWLRTLRLHGQVGCALQALGVGETPLEAPDPAAGEPRLGEPAVAATVRGAERRSRERGGDVVCTVDLLDALVDVYGEPFVRTLRRHGVTLDEVAQRLADECADEPETAG